MWHLVVLGAEQVADPSRPRQLVLRVVAEPGGERVHRVVATQLLHLGDDQAAVEAAGEVRAHRDVRDERRPDRLAHAVADRLDRVAGAPGAVAGRISGGAQ